jgi:murein DD-endopeptidase MepM/ murein hydrolase activator NlpD
MALDIYEPIVAAADGVVTFVGGDSSFGLGWYVEVDHGDGWSTTYAHLVEFNVYEGEEVGQGDVIGYNGNTGYSTGPHLHFEVHHNDWYVDPMVVLP